MKILTLPTNYPPTPVPYSAPTPYSATWSQNPSLLPLHLSPETALTRPDWPFFVPDWDDHVTVSTHLVVRISKLGKSIPARFAHRYYDEVTLGLTFTATDTQQQLQAQGLPTDIATGFDGAAYCGQQWLRLADLSRPIQDLHFESTLNGQPLHAAHTADMLHTVDQLIAYASRFYLLKTGDLLFTGSPSPQLSCAASYPTVHEGDLISATLEGHPLLTCRCK